jgi:hypothetical protein
MSDWPCVWILFVTFRRTESAIRTLHSLQTYLHYPNLHLHICDDGSRITDDGTDRNHIEVLKESWYGSVSAHEMQTPWGEFNMGGNTNEGIRQAREAGIEHLFLVQDDTLLVDPLDLKPYVCILCEHPQVGMMRLNYLSGGLAGYFIGYQASKLGCEVTFLRLIREWSLYNPWQTDTYLAAFQPSLVHTRFYDSYGLYPENYHPGLTECGMCAHYAQSELGEDGPQVLIPVHHWPMGVKWVHLQKRAHAYKELTGSDT